MPQRIKVTGYINVADIDEEHVDLDHESGLTDDGQQAVIHGEAGPAYQLKLSDLDDLELELK